VKHHPQKNIHKCVSILTGYPRADRRRYVVRLLNQVDRHHALRAGGHYDIHVYCDGDCGTLQTEFQHVAFHHLTTFNTANQSSENSERSLFQRLHNADETIKLSGVEFQRHRWLYVSQNYRHMLHDLFLPNPTRFAPYQSCVILEDDLVLAPDALHYLEAVERVMQRDRTIFTGSLFADNSYPLYARDRRRFRRVSHFAGLGFVMTRQRYVDVVRRSAWAGLQNWDEQVQKFVQSRRLVSIVPEISRALHLRRTSNSPEQSRPSHPFESQLLCDEILSEYNLDHLQQTSYDRLIAETIQHRQYIRYLADALFFDSVDETMVYFDCKNDKDLHRILAERSLWGFGNGGIVRGSYRGSLFFRYYVAQVLIVCRNSEFYLERSKTRSMFRPDTKNISVDGRRINRRVAGLVHRLITDFRVVVATRNQSCHYACDYKCDITGLWLLNESCDVITHMIPGCRRCATASVEDYVDGVLPGMDAEGDRCLRAYPHYISCETTSDHYRRFCVCR